MFAYRRSLVYAPVAGESIHHYHSNDSSIHAEDDEPACPPSTPRGQTITSESTIQQTPPTPVKAKSIGYGKRVYANRPPPLSWF